MFDYLLWLPCMSYILVWHAWYIWCWCFMLHAGLMPCGCFYPGPHRYTEKRFTKKSWITYSVIDVTCILGLFDWKSGILKVLNLRPVSLLMYTLSTTVFSLGLCLPSQTWWEDIWKECVVLIVFKPRNSLQQECSFPVGMCMLRTLQSLNIC